MPEVLDSGTIKALSTDTRQEIMKMLARRPHTASEISRITGKHVTTVTEHLDVLEKSGLVRKKESTNKWVYYELTDKGEHLFKPQFYSWIVVLSVSLVFVFAGFLRIFNSHMYMAGSQQDTVRAPMILQEAIKNASEQAPSTAQTAAPMDYLGIGLVILGIIGIAYLICRKYRH
jgi:DNA-binding transcriptional ArsR family regulator